MALWSTREVNEGDFQAIWKALEKSWVGNPKQWLHHITYEDGLTIGTAIIEQKDVTSVIIGEKYLLCYNIGNSWFTNKRILNECLILRLYNGPGKFADVVAFLEAKALEHDCIGVYTGTSLYPDDEKLAKVYEAHGFVRDGISLYKPTNKR